MGTPQQRISPSKESRSRQIRKLKTQENQDLPTAFLQNRILARVKSQRQINRFRILHGRLNTIIIKGTRQANASSRAWRYGWNSLTRPTAQQPSISFRISWSSFQNRRSHIS